MVARTGEPLSLLRAVGILLRWTREDVVFALRHLYLNRFAGSPLMPRAVRFLVYRSAGIQVGRVDILSGLTITGHPRNLRIGHATGVNVGCFFDCEGRITVGERVMMGMGVTLVTSDHPLEPDGRPQAAPEGRDIVIGDGVWLGARCMVLPGVTVGAGTIVSAGSVVTRDCMPDSVYAGVPARRVGPLPTGGSPQE
jgi:acetyltransferase-like isoleucine patch superfamily enzyme